MNIVSSSRMKEIDRISIEETGFGDLILMENAGIRILEEAEKNIGLTGVSDILCIAGPGNNGGDALVIARQLFSRFTRTVRVMIYREKGSDAFNFNLNLCRNLGIDITVFDDESKSAAALISGASVIFDGLSGTGISGELRAPAAQICSLVNSSNAVKISIDVPSGVGEQFRSGYTAVKADLTLTVGLPKRCLYIPAARPFCGRIITVKIGFPEELKNTDAPEYDGRRWKLYSVKDIDAMMPELQPGDYKNSRGHLAVFAGSEGTTGAASLCAEAAIHSPAGLVSLFADSDVYPLLASKHRAVMVKKLKPAAESGSGELLPDLRRCNAVAAGPGWGTAGRIDQLKALFKTGPGVLDADGINVLAESAAGEGEYPDLGGRWVLTPHAGEFRRLFPDLKPLEDPYGSAAAASDRLNAVIMLKGAATFIASPDGRAAVIDGAFPKLGTAGSGDLLCGLTGGYLAFGFSPFDAAVIAALVHLRAGKRCAENHEWFSADDLLNFL